MGGKDLIGGEEGGDLKTKRGGEKLRQPLLRRTYDVPREYLPVKVQNLSKEKYFGRLTGSTHPGRKSVEKERI